MAITKEEMFALCEESIMLREVLSKLRGQLKVLRVGVGEAKPEELVILIDSCIVDTFVEDGPAKETRALLLAKWKELARKKRYRYNRAAREGKQIVPRNNIDVSVKGKRLPTVDDFYQQKQENRKIIQEYVEGKDFL